MSIPNILTSDSTSPQDDPKTDPKVNPTGQEIITNADEADHVTNKDGSVADSDAIETELSESEPDGATNANNNITNDDGKSDATANNEELY